MQWVLWCGCPLQEGARDAEVPAAPQARRATAEPCAVCGCEIAPETPAYRIPASDAVWRRYRTVIASAT